MALLKALSTMMPSFDVTIVGGCRLTGAILTVCLQQRELAADGAPDTVHDDAYFGRQHRGGVQTDRSNPHSVLEERGNAHYPPLCLICQAHSACVTRWMRKGA